MTDHSQPMIASIIGLAITAVVLGLPLAGAVYDFFQRAMQ